MKLAMTCLALALALTGCGDGSDSTPSPTGTTPAASSPFDPANDPIPGPQPSNSVPEPLVTEPEPPTTEPEPPVSVPPPTEEELPAPASSAPYSNGADLDTLDNIWACRLNQLDMTAFYLILLDNNTGNIIVLATENSEGASGVIEWSENTAGDLEYVATETSEQFAHMNNRFEGNDTMLADSFIIDGEPLVDNDGTNIGIQCFREDASVN